jgi:hypothetical protein
MVKSASPEVGPARAAVWLGRNLVLPVRRPRRAALVGLVVAAALWGQLVDASLLPGPGPTANSTLAQATTAACFAVLGIVYGPVVGLAGGLLRDGTGYALALALQPGVLARVGALPWLGRAAADILEDMVLGWVPALVARHTRRLWLLAASAGLTAWLSLPFLVAADVLLNGQPDQLWAQLTTITGDWNEPVDPGLAVYALVTAALVAAILARWTARPRAALAVALAFALPALVLLATGAHL